jgi:predicted nucleotidyltransferase component of viral defense system
MILETTFTKTWIENLRKQDYYKKTDAANIEKMLYAFLLLEELVANKLEFIFKGGTALLLLFEKPYRFSIDIDIITNQNREQLENILNSIVEKKKFTQWNLDEKRSYKSGIPKAHYKLFYENANFGLGNSILLDVLFIENPYSETVKLPIKSDLLKTQEPYLFVTIPSANSILGDKITAFAPNTTGIKYNSGKEIEIIKQLF